MGPSRGDANVTRRAILAAARDLFARHGVDGVSVRQIAAAAGINHALVHRYFGTKDEMVTAIMLARGACPVRAMASPRGRPADARWPPMRRGLRLSARRGPHLAAAHDARRARRHGAGAAHRGGSPLRPLHAARRLARSTAPSRRSGRRRPIHGSSPWSWAPRSSAWPPCSPCSPLGRASEDRDPDEVLQGCLQTAVGLAAIAIGAPPAAAGAAPPEAGQGADAGDAAAREKAT